jgi:Protein of unknown function (DUF2892)
VNVGTAERIIRAVIGLVLLSLIFIGPRTWWGLIGLVLLGTAAFSYCPVWQLFGVNTCRK